jgi:hypothetical protein
MRKAVGVAAVTTVVALTGTGAGIAAPHASSAGSVLPTITVHASKHGFKVSGPSKFSAGRVGLVLTSKGRENTVEIASVKKGYSVKKARADIKAFFTKAGSGPHGSTPKSALKHLNRMINNVNFYGGLDAVPGQTERGSMVLPKAGKYFVINDTKLPKSVETLKVSGPAISRPAPKSSGTQTAVTKRRFKGPKTLPSKGTITFKNKSTESPHFLDLQHVKKGTTKKQVLKALESKPGQGPNIIRKGQAATDVLGEGNSQTLSYTLPKGTYAELCFFPDPKTGMPHALMGMIRIVTVK